MNNFKAIARKVTRISGAIMFLAMLNILFWMPASAATTAVVGNGSAASCTEAALETALAAGGDVTFNCGAAAHTINFTAAKNLNVNVAIDGDEKITLSGNDVTRLFNIPDGVVVTLRDISINNAPNSSSAIFNSGTLIAVNATFRNNLRGAIYNGGGTVTILDSAFEENQRSAVTNENDGTLSVSNSTFLRNTIPAINSGNGGGVYSPSGVATIYNSYFEGNSATDGGGAIYNSGVMTIENTTVFSNSAYGGGGVYSNDITTIINSRITANKATGGNGAGGGVQHFNQSQSASSLTIIASAIDHNESMSQGGGIWVSGSEVTAAFINSTIYTNTAQANGGGGLYVTNADVTLTNVTFSDNNAQTTDGDNLENDDDMPGSVTIRNTLIVNGGCVGTITNGNGNLQFPDGGCGVTVAAEDPIADTLGNNGGWTPTLAIVENGPAQNAGVNGNCPAADQRGVVRPQFATCDVGAFEWGALPILDNISPTSTIALSPTFTLVVNGNNFIPGNPATRVLWNGEELPTTYVNGTTLNATVAASRIVAGGLVSITVETPVIDGGVSEITKIFTIVKRDQSINFGELVDRTVDPANFDIAVTASSNLPVTFTAAGVCTVAGSTVTLTGELGTCTITAQQAGNESYNPAPSISQSFEVINPNLLRLPQVFGNAAID